MAEDRALRALDLLLRVLGRASALDGSDLAQTRSADDGESPRWLPEKLSDFTLQNYKDVINHPRGIDIITAFKNSLIVAISRGFAHRTVDVPAGYVFARMRFPGRNFFFAIVIASLIVPYEILLVPNYVRVWKLGWLNDYQVMIVRRWPVRLVSFSCVNS